MAINPQRENAAKRQAEVGWQQKTLAGRESGVVSESPASKGEDGQESCDAVAPVLSSGVAHSSGCKTPNENSGGSEKTTSNSASPEDGSVEIQPEAQVVGDPILDFIVTLNLGVTWIYEAGKKLVRMVDRDPFVFEDIIKEDTSGWLTKDVLKTIEAIGRREILPEVIMLPYHIASRLSAMPMAEQIRALDGVEVAILPRNGRGGYHVKKKPLQDLSINEARRVFAGNGVRSPEAQVESRRGVADTVAVTQVSFDRVRVDIVTKTLPDCKKQRVRLVDGLALIEFYEIKSVE